MYAQKLPKLPVPDLEQTLRKYLISVRPFLTEKEFSETVRVTTDFFKNEGPHLQSLLLSRAAAKDNWLSEWWAHVAYLSYRLPLPVHTAPAAMCDKLTFDTQTSLLDFASSYIIGVVEFLDLIVNGELPVDTHKGEPLCMQQYKKLVGHRIPGKKTDSQINALDSDYIILVNNGHYFKFPVFRYHNDKRSVLQSHEIKYLLAKMFEVSKAPTTPVGVLTTLDRDGWYEAREELRKSTINRKSLHALERCLFALLFDEAVGISNDYCLRRTMIGDLQNNFGHFNRWNDIGLQMIVSKDGYCSFLLEHSMADGSPAIVLGSKGYLAGITRSVPDLPVDSSNLPIFEVLQWELSAVVIEHIENAKLKLRELSDKLDLKTFSFTNFGKIFPKSYNISPDSIIQLGIQLAFYKLHRRTAACYESVSTRKFHDGRTETLRSTTTESTELVKSLLTQTSTEDRLRLLANFMKAHYENSRQASNGQGIDRHLLGLKLLASKEKLSPEFFSDPGFNRSIYFRLSTSQVPNPIFTNIAFGPVVENGYGIAYNPQDFHITFTLTAFTTCPDSVSAEKLSQVLSESLLDVKKLVECLSIPAKL